MRWQAQAGRLRHPDPTRDAAPRAYLVGHSDGHRAAQRPARRSRRELDAWGTLAVDARLAVRVERVGRRRVTVRTPRRRAIDGARPAEVATIEHRSS